MNQACIKLNTGSLKQNAGSLSECLFQTVNRPGKSNFTRMRRFFSMVLPALFLCNLVIAQDYVPTPADLEKFFKTKTLVVLEDNPLMEYNLLIQEIMKKEWNVTPFEVIPYSEFESKRKNPDYSFLMLMDVRFEKDKTGTVYKFLTLLLGGKYIRVNEMPSLVNVPLAYNAVDEFGYIFKLSSLVRFVQNHVKLIYEKPDIISNNVFKYYNDNMGDVKSKTLYVVEEELAPEVNSEKRIKAVYPYKFKIVTKDEVQKAIEDGDDNVVFLHKVGPEGTQLKARCYKILIGAADAKFYYFDYHMINEKNPDGFLESDFKKLGKK